MNSEERKENGWHHVRDWAKTIIIALLIALPIRFFIAEPFIVSGASMDPTFASGQFLIVDRLTYRFEKPERGDVVIFKYPNDPSVYYIKRVIGLPGETVAIKNGVVSVSNGSTTSPVVLEEPYIATDHRSYDTFMATLGPNQYFVMGDNRAQSSDSRYWGPLPSDLIIGRPIVRLFPFSELSVLPGQDHQTYNASTSKNQAQ